MTYVQRRQFPYKVELTQPQSGRSETVDISVFWNDEDVISAVGIAARAMQMARTKAEWMVTRVIGAVV